MLVRQVELPIPLHSPTPTLLWGRELRLSDLPKVILPRWSGARTQTQVCMTLTPVPVPLNTAVNARVWSYLQLCLAIFDLMEKTIVIIMFVPSMIPLCVRVCVCARARMFGEWLFMFRADVPIFMLGGKGGIPVSFIILEG